MNSWTNLGIYILALFGGTPESLFDQLESTQTTSISPLGYVPPKDTKELSTSDLVTSFTFPNTKGAPGVSTEIFATEDEHNTPETRRAWIVGEKTYSIETDYEEVSKIPKTGVTHQITLIVSVGEKFCGDGFCRKTQLINGTFPGPLIRGNWGDTFNITVHNNLNDCNGTSIHWHGIRQLGTIYADGVPGVTECPLAPGKQKTYTWRATQYGTGWYHSHFSLQYANGVAGPLIIDGPTSANYDEDKGPLLLGDWYHGNAFSLYYQHIRNGGTTDPPSSFLMNGQGNFTKAILDPEDGKVKLVPGCTQSSSPDDPCQLQLASTHATFIDFGKVYKYRIINISTQTSFRFWIDDHTFTLVAVDFVPIEPVENLKSIDVSIGQRYDILIKAKTEIDPSKTSNFWINMRGCNQKCFHSNPESESNVVECRQGLLRYRPDNEMSPTDYADPTNSDQCRDLLHTKLQPVVKRTLRGIFSTPMAFDEAFLVDRRKQTQDFEKVHGMPWGQGLGLVVPQEQTDEEHDEQEDEFEDDEGDENDEFEDDESDEFEDGESDELEDDESDEFEDDENDELEERKLVRRQETDPVIWNFGLTNSSNVDNDEPYQSMMIDWSFPTLWYSAVVGDETLPGRGGQDSNKNPRYTQLRLASDNNWQIFVIASDMQKNAFTTFALIPGAAHPIHLHGHDFVILYQSVKDEKFKYGQQYPLHLDNPPRRDVVMLPAKGFIIIGFKRDNPGAWLMHCHIAWHASAGLSLQFIEGAEQLDPLLGDDQQVAFVQTCQEWQTHESSHCKIDNIPAEQDDSGL